MRPIATLLVLLIAGCDEPAATPAPPPPPAVPVPTEPAREGPASAGPASEGSAGDQAVARATAAADDLGRTLRGRLLAAMAEGGPASAVRVCADEAPSMAAEAAARHGARVGRGSLRLRNPASAPPEWVAAWLREQGERSATGVTGFTRVEEGHARVLRPIAVEAPCLNCHGPAESISPEVAAVLHERYPDDAATGYQLGDLRGALWAEADLEL